MEFQIFILLWYIHVVESQSKAHPQGLHMVHITSDSKART
jgi:hypothetical protein